MINYQNNNGNTLLHYITSDIICSKKNNIIEFILVEFNNEINLNLHNNNGKTILMFLFENNISFDFIYYLFKKLPINKINFNLKDNNGENSLSSLTKNINFFNSINCINNENINKEKLNEIVNIMFPCE
jgi:hypothetical protein